MQLYSAKIRLGGSVLNEVAKIGLTAPEVIILQNIHGGDAVVDLKSQGEDRRSHDDERERLELTYGANPDTKRPWVTELFGAAHVGLPTEIAGVDIKGSASPKRSRRSNVGKTADAAELMG